MPWRIISSVIRGLILQIYALFAYNCLLSFAPLTPIQWITSNFVVFITPTSWFYDLIIVACFAGLALLQSKELRMVSINYLLTDILVSALLMVKFRGNLTDWHVFLSFHSVFYSNGGLINGQNFEIIEW